MCQCPGAVYDDWARAAFDPDVYDCARCGHTNGVHHGPEGECAASDEHAAAPTDEDGGG